MKVIVSFQNKLDTSATEKTQSDERLSQDKQQLMIHVHQQFLDIDTAIQTISSVQPSSSQTAPQRAPQTVQVQWRNQVNTRGLRGSAGTNERHNPAGRSTDPAGSSTDSSITRNRRRYSVDPIRWTDHRKLDLDMKPEGFVARLSYLSAERPDVRKLDRGV